MLRAALLSALLVLTAAPAARAEIRVIDTKAGTSRTLVRERKLDRIGMESIDRRFDGGSDSAVLEAVADGLDPWLRAAGFERIEALDELLCV